MAAYNRITSAFKAFLDEIWPNRRYVGNFLFTVTSCDYLGQTCDADPVTPELGMPSLVGIPISTPLLAVKLVPGQVITVGFQNNSPAYPYVSGIPAAGGGTPVVRTGDACWTQFTIAPITAPGQVIPAFGIVPADPTKLGPAIPPVPGLLTFKAYGIAASGSQFVKSK
jgi:hypothetical protein